MENTNISIRLVANSIPEKNNIFAGFDGVIGQETVINKLKFLIDSGSIQKDLPFPTLLFTGSHGLGKTYIAGKLAKSMDRRYVEINCSILKTVDQFINDILIEKILGDSPVTVLLDEAHRLPSNIMTVMLTLISPRKENVNILKTPKFNIEYDMSKINVVLGTTDAHLIEKPLLNRSLRIYFESYSKDDLLKMLKLYLPDITFSCDHDDLANACRGRGRDAFQLSQFISRYCSLSETKELNQNGWEYIKNVFEIFHLGLNRQEVKMLEIIKEHQPISCANIAMLLMVNEENVEGELEIRCRELDLIRSTTRGRELTEKGEKYIEGVKK